MSSMIPLFSYSNTTTPHHFSTTSPIKSSKNQKQVNHLSDRSFKNISNNSSLSATDNSQKSLSQRVSSDDKSVSYYRKKISSFFKSSEKEESLSDLRPIERIRRHVSEEIGDPEEFIKSL